MVGLIHSDADDFHDKTLMLKLEWNQSIGQERATFFKSWFLISLFSQLFQKKICFQLELIKGIIFECWSLKNYVYLTVKKWIAKSYYFFPPNSARIRSSLRSLFSSAAFEKIDIFSIFYDCSCKNCAIRPKFAD